MLKGTPGEWYSDDSIGGYYDENGDFVACEEYLTDAQADRYSVEVQNGDGYYDDVTGRFIRTRFWDSED